MRNIIYLILLLTFSFTNHGCEKEKNNNSKILEWSKITALKNGLKWEASAVAFKYGQDTVIIQIHVRNQAGYLRESLIIRNLPITVGNYVIYKRISNSNQLNTNASFNTISDDGDVIEDMFDVLESQNNYIDIKKVDLTNMEMSGTLQITFIRNALDPIDNPSLGDTISFTDGVFRLKIVE